jgi:hypothetical protein
MQGPSPNVYPCETRGRPKKLSARDLDEIEKLIISNGEDGRTMPYFGMVAAAGLDIDVSAETVCKAVELRYFYMCVACEKKWVLPNLVESRVEYL